MINVGPLEKYFALLPDRQCGDCMICCEYMPISAQGLIKPAETLCPHVIVNRGCSIYDSRPNVCRTWHCLWRRDAAMSDALRPDKSGMIFSLIIYEEPRSLFENAHITCIALKSKAAYEAPLVAETIRRYIDEGVLPVWLSFGGGKSLVYPDPVFAVAIERPATSQQGPLVERGKEWRQRYEAMLEDLQARNGLYESAFVKR